MVSSRQTLVRCSSAVLIFALLMAPLAVLIRSSARGASRCTGMCCRPRGTHASQGQDQAQESRTGNPLCERGATRHTALCLINTRPETEYVCAAPLRPVTLCAQARMSGPQIAGQTTLQRTETPLAGFLPIPFEPPRS